MKFLSLFKNERIKLTRRAAFIVIAILLGVAVVGMPVMKLTGSLMEKYTESMYNDDGDYYDSLQEFLDSDCGYGEYGEEDDDDGGQQPAATKRASMIFDTVKSISVDADKTYAFAKYTPIDLMEEDPFVDYIKQKEKIYLIECIRKGYTDEDIALGFAFSDHFDGMYYYNGRKYLDMPKNKLDKAYKKAQDKMQADKEFLDIINVEELTLGCMAEWEKLAVEYLDRSKEALAKTERLLKDAAPGADVEGKLVKKKNEEVYVYANQKRLDLIRWMTANLDAYNKNEWVRNTVSNAMSLIRDNDGPHSEYGFYITRREAEEYSLYDDFERIGGYEGTVRESDYRVEQWKNSIACAEYSLEHQKPSAEFIYDGRTDVLDGLAIIPFIAVLCVILAGGSVSSEFSSGTIRLLVLRPVTRTKIMLSKVAAVVWTGAVYTLGASLLAMLGNGLVGGLTSLAHPIITVLGGNIVEINFVLYYFGMVLIGFVNVLYMITFAVLLSTLFKNTALAVGVSLAAMFGGEMIIGVLMMSVPGTEMFSYIYSLTPFAYMDLIPMFIQKNTVTYAGFYDYDFGISVFGSLTPLYGLLLMLGLSIVYTALATLIFNKREIKS